MNAYLNQRNHTSLTDLIEITAHSISLFQGEKLTNISELLISQNNISIAEPVEIQIDGLGNTVTTMYQFVGGINVNTVPGSESTLNYINDDFYTKYGSAINQHKYNFTKKHFSKISQHTLQTKSLNLRHIILRITGTSMILSTKNKGLQII